MITSDVGLLACREQNDAVGLTDTDSDVLADTYAHGLGREKLTVRAQRGPEDWVVVDIR